MMSFLGQLLKRIWGRPLSKAACLQNVRHSAENCHLFLFSSDTQLRDSAAVCELAAWVEERLRSETVSETNPRNSLFFSPKVFRNY